MAMPCVRVSDLCEERLVVGFRAFRVLLACLVFCGSLTLLPLGLVLGDRPSFIAALAIGFGAAPWAVIFIVLLYGLYSALKAWEMRVLDRASRRIVATSRTTSPVPPAALAITVQPATADTDTTAATVLPS